MADERPPICNECRPAYEEVYPASHFIDTPEGIIQVLHSIVRVEMTETGLDTWFRGGTSSEAISGFVPGTFTRKLLELIEEHLSNGNEQK